MDGIAVQKKFLGEGRLAGVRMGDDRKRATTSNFLGWRHRVDRQNERRVAAKRINQAGRGRRRKEKFENSTRARPAAGIDLKSSSMASAQRFRVARNIFAKPERSLQTTLAFWEML